MAAERTTWVVTRDAFDGEAEARVLQASGIEAVSVPCIECVERAWPEWAESPNPSVVLITSRHAAQCFEAHGDRTWQVAATAPATALWLEAKGIATAVQATGGAVALAEAVVTWWRRQGSPKYAVRYPTSDAGLTSLEQDRATSLLSEIDEVERRCVYETRAAPRLSETLGTLGTRRWSVAFASPSAVEAFLAAISRLELSPPSDVVCFGRSTERSWNQARVQQWPAARLSQSVLETILTLEHAS